MASIDVAKKAIEDAATSVDQGLTKASKTVVDGAASAIAMSNELYSKASPLIDQGMSYINEGFQQYSQYEDVVFSAATSGIHWAAANPYVAYPTAGMGAILLLPFTRRLLYRQTIGRLRNPEAIVRSCEGRVKGISARLEDYNGQVDKLQARMIKAEEEYKAGMANLRATRLEMQRLSSALSKGERSAKGLLQELRAVSPKLENALQIRGEAASQASVLKSQRDKVDKWVRRIANMDI